MSVGFTLTASPVFGQGVTVGAYPRRYFPGPPPQPGQKPVIAATVTAVVDAHGFATFSGLEEETDYFAGAEVAGVFRWTRFRTALPPPPEAGGARSVLEFGATGVGADDTAAFEAGYAAVQGEGGGELFVPPGVYGITQFGVLFPDLERPVYLVGAGRFVSTLKKLGGGTGAMITYGEHGTVGAAFVTNSPIRGVSIVGNGVCGGVVLEKTAWFAFEDIDVENCDVGVWSKGALTFEIANSLLRGNKTGFKTTSSFDGSIQSNLITLRKCVISNNTSHGVDASAAFLLNVDNCDIEQNGKAGDLTTGGIIIREPIGAIANINRIGNNTWLEENYGCALRVEAGETFVDHCLFVNTDPATAGTQGRNILVTGSAPLVLVEKCGFSRTFGSGAGKNDIVVDHECHGGVRDCNAQPPLVDKASGPSFLREQELGSYVAEAPQAILGASGAAPALLFGVARSVALVQEAPGVVASPGILRAGSFNLEDAVKKGAAAANFDLFYDVDKASLCFKDAAGVVRVLAPGGPWSALETLVNVTNVGATFLEVGARVEAGGASARLRGLLKTGASIGPGTTLFTLPAVCRPVGKIVFAVPILSETLTEAATGFLVAESTGAVKSLATTFVSGKLIVLDDTTYSLT